jgi:hypothetical protein
VADRLRACYAPVGFADPLQPVPPTSTGAPEAARPAFYEPPATISGAPGTILRSEPAAYALDPLGLSSAIATATKVMYVSRDRLGRPIAVTGMVIVPRAPWDAIIADNRIGNRRPTVPGHVDHSLLDVTIPYAVGRQLAKDWCATGANVVFTTNATPTHVGGMTNHVAEAPLFFGARFNGVPQVSTCWAL